MVRQAFLFATAATIAAIGVEAVHDDACQRVAGPALTTTGDKGYVAFIGCQSSRPPEGFMASDPKQDCTQFANLLKMATHYNPRLVDVDFCALVDNYRRTDLTKDPMLTDHETCKESFGAALEAKPVADAIYDTCVKMHPQIDATKACNRYVLTLESSGAMEADRLCDHLADTKPDMEHICAATVEKAQGSEANRNVITLCSETLGAVVPNDAEVRKGCSFLAARLNSAWQMGRVDPDAFCTEMTGHRSLPQLPLPQPIQRMPPPPPIVEYMGQPAPPMAEYARPAVPQVEYAGQQMVEYARPQMVEQMERVPMQPTMQQMQQMPPQEMREQMPPPQEIRPPQQMEQQQMRAQEPPSAPPQLNLLSTPRVVAPANAKVAFAQARPMNQQDYKQEDFMNSFIDNYTNGRTTSNGESPPSQDGSALAAKWSRMQPSPAVDSIMNDFLKGYN